MYGLPKWKIISTIILFESKLDATEVCPKLVENYTGFMAKSLARKRAELLSTKYLTCDSPSNNKIICDVIKVQ